MTTDDDDQSVESTLEDQSETNDKLPASQPQQTSDSTMAAGAAPLPTFQKLKGQENWSTWKFQMFNFLNYDDLWDVTDPTQEGNDSLSNNSATKLKQRKASAKINLMIEPCCIVHVRNTETPSQAWQKLQKAYESSGLSRRLRLLRNLFNVRLENFPTMTDYISEVLNLSQQLNDISAPLDDEFIGVILLSGLTADFDAMVLALEHSQTKITSDLIKSKLLDHADKKVEENAQAFFTGKRPYKTIKCNYCGLLGHRTVNCRKKPKGNGESNTSTNNASASSSSHSNGKDSDIKTNQQHGKKKPKHSFFTALASFNFSCNEWFLDSGASKQHMTCYREILTEFQTLPPECITTASNTVIKSQGQGNCLIKLQGSTEPIEVHDVLYVPDLTVNLLSVSRLISKGLSVLFDDEGGTIINSDGDIIATASLFHGVYKLDVQSNEFPQQQTEVSFTSANLALQYNQTLWHRRLGHLNMRSMNLLKNSLADGITYQNSRVNKPCAQCVLGKQTSLPFGKSSSRAKAKLEIIHTDLCGPMPVPSHNGAKYILTFTDDFTRKTWVYFLKAKSEVFNKFRIFQNLVEKQSDRSIKCLRSDNGKEYDNSKFHNFFDDIGVRHLTTVDYTPQQNGVAERVNRTLLEKARCMLFDANLPKSYWAEAVNHAAFLKNRSPSRAIPDHTPEEMWSGERTNLVNLKIFGCKAYCHLPKVKRNKLDAKSKIMIFVGFCENSKAYRLIDPQNPTVFTKARDVIFDETSFLNKDPSLNYNNEPQFFSSTSTDDSQTLSEQNDVASTSKQTPQSTKESQTKNKPITNESKIQIEQVTNLAENSNKMKSTSFEETADLTEEDEEDISSSENSSHEESYESINSDQITTVISELLPDSQAVQPQLTSETDVQERPTRPHNLPAWTADYKLWQALIHPNNQEIPDTPKQALKDPEWKRAMEKELQSFENNNAWEIVDKPHDQKLLETKWVFKTKINPSDHHQINKARLVIKGCAQRYGIDYLETFSPVVRHSTLRLLFALSVHFNLNCYHFDAMNAFLHGELNEQIYVKPPEGLILPENKVLRLKKAVYGLKQAPRSWNSQVNSVLINSNYQRSKHEPCVYYKRHDKKLTIIAVFVDDFFTFSNDQEETKFLKKKLFKSFNLKDLGKISNCLGMAVTQNEKSKTIKLSHEKYILELLEKFNMTNCKPVSTPIIKTQFDDLPADPSLEKTYQQLIGSLLYLSVTSRPDISYAVTFLSQFSKRPNHQHWTSAKRILRYLKGTSNHCLTYKKSNNNLMGFADSDWANNDEKRKSFSGNVFIFSNGAVSWECHKQRTVALSSTEAEYLSLSDASKEAIYLKNLLEELTGISGPITLNCDNQSTLALAENPVHHRRTKHIDVRHHYIREQVENKQIILNYVPDEQMVADVLTKPIPNPKLKFCANGFGLKV